MYTLNANFSQHLYNENFLLTETFLSVILRLTSPVLCLAYNMILRMVWLKVAGKRRGNQCFKSQNTVCQNEISNQCLFSNAKRTANAHMKI